jgi:hypothetical protein
MVVRPGKYSRRLHSRFVHIGTVPPNDRRETAVRLVPIHPRATASFAYDPASRTLSAYHADGKVTLCSDVPAAMFHILQKTPTPEEFFLAYIASRFPCEIASARLKRQASR